MYRIELSYLKKARNKLLISLLFMITIAIILITILVFDGDIIMNDILKDIIISIISGTISSTAISIFIYFKYLKSIPEETEKKINNLLNERLSYETTQHEGTMRALNPDNAHLSLDHREINKNILHLKDKINSYETEKKIQYNLLDSNGRNIANSIETLNTFSSLYQETNKKIIHLESVNDQLSKDLEEAKREIDQLKEKNLELTMKNKELSKNRDSRFNDFLEL